MAQTTDTTPGRSEGATAAAPATYLRLQITLHWSIAALVLVQLLVNDAIHIAFRTRLDAGAMGPGEAMPPPAGAGVHVSVGLLILGLSLIRLAVRMIRGAPPPAPGVPPVLHLVGATVHRALHALVFLMPLTGAVAWFGAVETAAILHEIGRFCLIALIAAHGFAALFEHFALRNITLLRMLGQAGR